MQTEYELMHHGILGMKWGVRRYQAYGEGGYNPKHKGKVTGKAARRKAAVKRKRESRKQDSKDRMLISDKALNEKIKRLQDEKRLKDLTEETLHPGRSFVKKLAKGTALTAATGAGAYAGYILLQKAIGTRVKLPKPQIALTSKGLKNVNGGLKRLKGAKLVVGKAEWDKPKQIAAVVMKGGFKKK